MCRCQDTAAASRLRARWGRGFVWAKGVATYGCDCRSRACPRPGDGRVASKLCSYNREWGDAARGVRSSECSGDHLMEPRTPNTREGRRTPGLQGKRHMDVPRPRVRTGTCARAVTWRPGVRRPPPKPRSWPSRARACLPTPGRCPGDPENWSATPPGRSRVLDVTPARRSTCAGHALETPSAASPAEASTVQLPLSSKQERSGAQRDSSSSENGSASSMAGKRSRCAARAAADNVVVSTCSLPRAWTWAWPRKSITALSPS